MPLLGTCALCGTPNVELQSSHVIPSFAYKRAQGRDKGQAMERTNGRSFRLTSAQLQYPLLARCCELRMKAWEDTVAHFVHHADGRFPARDDLHWTLVNAEPAYSDAAAARKLIHLAARKLIHPAG